MFDRRGEKNAMFGRHGEEHPCFKHGYSFDPTYISWNSMIQRCTNLNHEGWIYYGGATPPVKVCERWRTFENFLADMGERPAGTSLGRLGDVGNYEPENCAWQTTKEQGAERRSKRQLALLAA
jgi:hypothetical protein